MTLLKTLGIAAASIAMSLSSTAMAEKIDFAALQAKASEIKEANEYLNHPDSSVRLAAIEAMINSDSLAMREAAYAAGLASADDAVRALAARKRFAEKASVVIELELPENATEEQKKLYKYLSGSFSFKPNKYDANTGAIEFYKGTASVSGITFSLKRGDLYSAKLMLNDESVYEGTFFGAEYGHKGSTHPAATFPAKLTLQ